VAEPERLGRGDVDAVAAVLARAFADDPVLTFLLGAGRGRERELIFGALCRDAERAGVIEGVVDAGRLTAVAVWLPPGAHPVPLRREARMVPSWLRLAGQYPRAVPRLLRAMPALDRLHPHEPHWFLSLLGTEPGLQGRGLGSALVAPGVRRAEVEGVPVHLDTGRPENVPWYRRFGFDVTDEVRLVPGAPPTWGMRKGGSRS
jgi:ribosomal protein S18 acetylase RimI-like enzyme